MKMVTHDLNLSGVIIIGTLAAHSEPEFDLCGTTMSTGGHI
jgi:hypothetical protein